MKLLLVLFLLTFGVFYGQLESAHWYFGHNAGLDFTSGTAVPVFDGALNTKEGCASISDSDGNLLFYTDGRFVYNRNHQLMPNGQGLMGDSSSTQSAIIVPFPRDETKYYIFTVGAYDGTDLDPNPVPEGFHYYLVDMNLNGGLGDVEPFDNETNGLPQFPEANLSSEKITAVIHNNSLDFWVITHFRDSFYAYKVTEQGVQNPVITTIGPYFDEQGYPVNARGYLKASPDGSKIAIAHLSHVTTGFGINYSNDISHNATAGVLGIYDFNNQTGIIRNEQILNDLPTGEFFGSPYGIEFSSDSQKLYAQLDYHNEFNIWQNGKLIQYNIATNPITETALAEGDDFLNLGTSETFRSRGALQLALDGKIYYSLTRFSNPNTYIGHSLSIIHNPNVAGLGSNLELEALQINVGNPNITIAMGLPPFVTSFFILEIVFESTQNVNDACVGEEVSFGVNTNADIASITWNFGDGNTSNETSPTHTYDTPGQYAVSVLVVDTSGVEYPSRRTINIHPNPVVSPATLIECDPDDDGLANFQLNLANSQIIENPSDFTISYHLTENESFNNENSLNTPFQNTEENQVLFVRVESEFGCVSYTNLTLETNDELIPLATNLFKCDDDFDGFVQFNLGEKLEEIENLFSEDIELTFHANQNDATLNINPIPLNYINVIAHRDPVFVRVISENQCLATITFDLIVNSKPVEELDNRIICPQDDATTYSLSGYQEYLWSGLQGEDALQPNNTESVTITQAGNYTVYFVNENGCDNTADFIVEFAELPVIESVAVSNVTTATILFSGDGYEFSIDGENWTTGNVFHDLRSGIYTAYIRSTLGCIGATYQFGIIEIPNFLSPNNDGLNDYWNVPGVNAYPGAVVQIFDRYGKELIYKVIQPTQIGEISYNRGVNYQNTNGSLWDGKYLGRVVPTTSYWYIITLTDGRKFTGWITVKNI